MPANVIYRDNRSPAQRIQDRLKSSSPASGLRPQDRLSSQAQTETLPTRAITNVYIGGSQHCGDDQ
jgi:hypothetical protein